MTRPRDGWSYEQSAITAGLFAILDAMICFKLPDGQVWLKALFLGVAFAWVIPMAVFLYVDHVEKKASKQ